jgi:DNA-binding response OmpR family regulator
MPSLKGEHMRQVLIVEDEWLLAEGLKVDLEERGYAVLGPALSCKDALGILFDHEADLAFVDTQLGDETCEAVLDECDKRSIPVIIYTAHSEDELPKFARGRKFLAKPYASVWLSDLLEAGETGS